MDRLEGLLESERGLTAEEVRARRQRFGRNQLLESAGSPWAELARETLRDPMLWFLVGTGILYLALGERVEGLSLLAAMAPLVGMDAFLHRRTQASTAGLQSRLASSANVVLNGSEVRLPSEELVPGDLALVRPGEYFPADGLLLSGTELQVDESSLTGEAFPVRKQPLPALLHPKEPAPVLEGEHWGLAGTRLLTGTARLRVALTGQETLYGAIVRSAVRGSRARTPLQLAISNLVAVLLVAALLICLILAYVRLRQGYGWVDALVSAVTLAVAALPEEFPVVFTFFLGVGVFRLARQKALVRRAVSVENIGRVSCICSDKTGTVTEGLLRVAHLLPAPGVSEQELLLWAALASRRESGDPLDTAILDEAEHRGSAPRAFQLQETFPFTEERRRETAVLRGADGTLLAAAKGAPEQILSTCELPGEERERWEQRMSELARAGHKVLAVASRPLQAGGWVGGEPSKGYRLAGLLACEDPVREGVREAIIACREAGIHVLLVTGDHPVTARAVASELGLGGVSPSVIAGDELEELLAREPGQLRGMDVIARALPSQKLALVRALQREGEVVAVTGDGVNDVPALQAADIGIAMGVRGTRSAREVAAIVLLDDNFRSIVRAVAEGRRLFHNLQLSFQYLLMIHVPLVVTAALVPLAGFPLLYLPLHIVWLELLIHPTALLVFQDLPAPGLVARAQPRARVRFFSRVDWLLVGLVGGLGSLAVLLGYERSLGVHNVEHARAMALVVLTTLSAALTAVLSGLRTATARWMTGGTLLTSLLLVQLPASAALLQLQPLHVDDWASALGGGAAAILPLLARALLRRG